MAVPDELEAELVCGLLRSEGVACFSRVGDVAAQGMLAHGGWHEVYVYERDADRARELLEAANIDLEAVE